MADLLEESPPGGFLWFLVLVTAALYSAYGFCMGLYRCDLADLGLLRGALPAFTSALKLPILYLLSLAVCLPSLYVLNCIFGPRLSIRATLFLLLLAMSCNAVAVASYTPIGLFFTLTTSRAGYAFIVLMHVSVFAGSGFISLAVASLMFRSASHALSRRLQNQFLVTWGILYGLVLSQMSWTLRPWIGSWAIPYSPFRPIEGTFFGALWHLLAT